MEFLIQKEFLKTTRSVILCYKGRTNNTTEKEICFLKKRVCHIVYVGGVLCLVDILWNFCERTTPIFHISKHVCSLQVTF